LNCQRNGSPPELESSTQPSSVSGPVLSLFETRARSADCTDFAAALTWLSAVCTSSLQYSVDKASTTTNPIEEILLLLLSRLQDCHKISNSEFQNLNEENQRFRNLLMQVYLSIFVTLFHSASCNRHIRDFSLFFSFSLVLFFSCTLSLSFYTDDCSGVLK